MAEAQTIWKRVALTGCGITIAGAVPVGFSDVEFFERFGEDIFLPFMVGLLVLLIGLIGWAALLSRKARVRMAVFTLAPLPLIWIGGALANANIHGTFPLVFLASIPLFAAGIILGIMALAARRT